MGGEIEGKITGPYPGRYEEDEGLKCEDMVECDGVKRHTNL